MFWSAFLTAVIFTAYANGHGRLIEPPSRSSAWRFGFATPPDYDDDGANCGGFGHQWGVNGGKCGVCGDSYELSTPRPHELGGTYGLGVIVNTYKPGQIVTVSVELTTSHLGYYVMRLCEQPESDECFIHTLELSTGGTQIPVKDTKVYTSSFKLPDGVTCNHCVLQWRYRAGNNWGDCGNGTSNLGCGPQEHFYACADVAILN